MRTLPLAVVVMTAWSCAHVTPSPSYAGRLRDVRFDRASVRIPVEGASYDIDVEDGCQFHFLERVVPESGGAARPRSRP